MDPYWQFESELQQLEDLDAFLFDLPPQCARGDDLADFLVDAPPVCFPTDARASPLVKEQEEDKVQKPALVQKKSSKGPSVAHKTSAPLPATRPVRASRSAPQKQQLPTTKQVKASQAGLQQQQQQPGTSGSADDTDYMSEDTEEAGAAAGKGSSGSKRPRAPEVDWRAIQDPEERRRQRRLAKNRLTAARSRERKKMILSELETRLQGFEAENARLQDMLAAMSEENKSLRQQLGQLFEGGVKGYQAAAGGGSASADSSSRAQTRCSSSSSVKVLLALLLCMCVCNLSWEQLGIALGGAVPLLVLAQCVLEGDEGWGAAAGASKRRRTSSSSNSTDSSMSPPGGRHPQHAESDALARFLAAISHVSAYAMLGSRRSLQRVLYSRPPRVPKGMFVISNSSSKSGGEAQMCSEAKAGWPGLPAKPLLLSRGPACLLPF